MVAAHLFASDEVGTSTAIISSMSLIVLLSRLGLDYSLIRYFPRYNKPEILGTSAIVTSICAVLVGLSFLIGSSCFSQELAFLGLSGRGGLFLIFVLAASLDSVFGNAFVAARRASFFFAQSLVMGVRVPLLFSMVSAGAVGIYGSVGLSFVIALAVSYSLLTKLRVSPVVVVDREYLGEAFRFSASNYVAGLFIACPPVIMPSIVLGILGPESAAYYYIAYSVAALMYIVPNAVSMSLFVEGSYGEGLRKITKKTLLLVVPGLSVSGAIIAFSGETILGFFGLNYVLGSLQLLRIMVVSAMLTGICFIYYSIARVRNNLRGLVLVSGSVFLSLVLLSVFLGSDLGLVGIGYAWILSNLVGCGIIAAELCSDWRMQRLYHP